MTLKKWNVYFKAEGSKYQRYFLINAINEDSARLQVEERLKKKQAAGRRYEITKIEQSQGFWV